MDADLRKPSQHNIFGLGRQHGLTNLLLGSLTLDEALRQEVKDGLTVIPSGPLPPDPAQVLRLPQMREVLERLRERADLVIIDSAPLLAVSEALVLPSMADAVLMVIDVHATRRQSVERAVAALRQAIWKGGGCSLQ